MENTKRSSLDELAGMHNTDKSTTYPGQSRHGYAPFYDKILSHWRDESIRMLEVGICMEGTAGGHSVRMWRDYFSKAELYTFDIVDMHWMKNASEFNGRVSFYQGDQGNRDSLSKMYESFGSKPFDFILEDGSHQHVHQMVSLGHLFQYVKPGGIYILEDISIPGRPVCCIRNDETFQVLEDFAKTNKIYSKHLTPDECAYLEENIVSMELHADIQNAYCTAVFIKK